MDLRRLLVARRRLVLVAGGLAMLIAALAPTATLLAQTPTGSNSSGPSSISLGSSSSSAPGSQAVDTAPQARIVQPEAAGSAITLETSEPLFYLAAGLNACGYDTGLADSDPVRAKVRGEINAALVDSAEARDARDALCSFIQMHALADTARDVAQYISLSLYLTAPPALAPSAEIPDLPPDSTQVIEVLPVLRAFGEAVQLHAIWYEHRPEYEALVDRVHDPLTKMVLATNLYLHLPASNYDGRRFMVLLEPMLAPSETNARYDGLDSAIVVSPRAGAPDTVPMDLIRHTYLHFTVEPLVYPRAAAMSRLLPLLKTVQQAPLEIIYKSDIGALVNECLIKAIEARTMETGIAAPAKPASLKDRVVQELYTAQMDAYGREAEAARRRKVDLDMRQGWVLVDYFYGQLGNMEKEDGSLKDEIGPMIYGMDVDSERHHIQQIAFLPEGSGEDVLHRAPRPLGGLGLAESKLMKGDIEGAAALAEEALKTDPNNAEAHYLLGRMDLMQADADGALDQLSKAVQLSHDPRTIAWAHIYLGRMYDIARDPDNADAILPQREKALAEYRAALANRDSQPDTKAAAEAGIKAPFTLPRRAAANIGQEGAAPADDQPLDPTGKAEKEAYRPSESQ